MASEGRLIALVTRQSKEAEQKWLATLTAAMPHERIIPFADLSEAERALVDIAIVANPDPDDVRRLPNLQWVHSLWAGVERLVLELKGFDRPIVRLVDPKLSETMAEAVLAWTLYLSRDMPAYADLQQRRVWQELPYRAACDLRVGLLGLGALGSAAAKLLRMAGFQVSGWSRSQKDIPGVSTYSGADGLKQLLAQSDIVVCLVPLTAETRGLMGAEQFALMPKGAELINFARGPVVVTEDLIAALDSGQIKHAVLDVFDKEPLDETSPLWSHRQVTVLPHISAPTNPSTAALIVAGNIAAYRSTGELPQSVDFARGY